MQQLTFAAIWTDLTTEEREILAELANVSVPVLALTNINKFYHKVPEILDSIPGGGDCACPGCTALRTLKLKLKDYNRRRK